MVGLTLHFASMELGSVFFYQLYKVSSFTEDAMNEASHPNDLGSVA